MDEDTMMTATQPGLFQDEKNAIEEQWECQKIVSPAGTWYLVREEKDREIYERPTKSGRTRAVFSRNEMFNCQQALNKMEPPLRQQWLASVILIKEAMPGARIEILREVVKPSSSVETFSL